MNIYLGFSICALLIILSGWHLSYYADIIAETTGLGRGFIGLILLAAVTSLPEMITSGTDVIVRNAPDLALGNIFGSNMFNIFIIALLEIIIIRRPFLYSISKKNISYAGFVIMATMFAAIPMLGFDISMLGISLFSLAIAIVYLYSMYSGYKNIKGEEKKEEEYGDKKLAKAAAVFLLLSAVIVLAGRYATLYADDIAAVSGLGRTFVGGLLLAAMTSLPEVITSISSARLKAYDMIVGNLLGSNLFNLAIIFVSDAIYRKGSIFMEPSPNQLLPALFSIILISCMVFGIMRDKPKGEGSHVHPETFLIMIFYFAGIFLMYVNR